MAQVQLQRGHQITLRGSAQIVMEFFDYSINSILFQRAIYPAEDFKMVKKYGLNLLITTDDTLQAYLRQILTQVQKWIMTKSISKLVLVISSRDSREVLERWQFLVQLESSDIPCDKENLSTNHTTFQKLQTQESAKPPKSEKEIHAEIAAILRQITASVSFLPELCDACTFNVLAYTDRDAQVPSTWVDSDARMIVKNSEQVRLRSFSTTVHKVDALVAYRVSD
ncbi:mitotic spindle checkpoint component mad2 [Zopfochytrium polystomum]|nr:mitotic spindle checkpoint component mad2 [Zopfochytrium polystomum]